MEYQVQIPPAKDCNSTKLLEVLNSIDFVCREYTKDIDLASSASIDPISSELMDAAAALKTDAPFMQTVYAKVDIHPASNNPEYYLTVNLARNVKISVLSVTFWSGKFYDYQQAFEVKQKLEKVFHL